MNPATAAGMPLMEPCALIYGAPQNASIAIGS
jgi:hypothetical protein